MSDPTLQPPLLEPTPPPASGPVECLGLTFPNDDVRRAYFKEQLRTKLQDPTFRQIEGFPIGSDEDILALSDPPYYTACPNPFLEEFIRYYGKPYDSTTDTYHREPFAVDVSVGKTDALYKAHGYHTKVPHLAIVPSILHYTEPGDIVLDGFCGSGMTGVAAQWCGSAPQVYRQEVEMTWEKDGRNKPQWGSRRVVLSDLSPAATFIAANYNLPFDLEEFRQAGQRILNELETELGWMYETMHTDGKTKGRIEYTVWSEVFSCPNCASEVVFLETALDENSRRVKDSFLCQSCNSELSKQRLERIYITTFDPILKHTISVPKRKPVLISYKANGQRYEKKITQFDLDILERVNSLPSAEGIPVVEIPKMHMTHERARLDQAGVTHIHHFFLARSTHALSALWSRADIYPDVRVRHMLLFYVEQAIWGMSLLARYTPTHYSQVNQYLTGVYYVASQIVDVSPWYILDGKLQRLVSAFRNSTHNSGNSIIQAGDCGLLKSVPDGSIDYIFTDPPFGENIYYADLNFLVESWHRVFTNATPEAIIDRFKGKSLTEYQQLMQRCFQEYYRILKPGRWMTVVFHNSRNAVWNAIQEAMLVAGFVVADVRTLDKQQGSFRQVTSTAVKQDLVISAYKPSSELERRFELEKGTEDGVWEFVRTHLQQLPVFLAKDGQAETIAERQNYLLFDRLVAFYVQRNVSVPVSAAEFYQGLARRFPERDSMYFLPEQAAEYDKKRMRVKEALQLSLIVTDESSAIQWLKQQLAKKPQTFQELHPQFLRELGGWQKYEKPLELSDLLEQNFLHYDGKGDVPSQIHSYLSTNYREFRNLTKDDLALRSFAKDKWYVPDPSKTIDLEKLRERALLREFQEYVQSKQRVLKAFRLEAVRAGFKKAWQEREYPTIISVAEKIPENVLQEDAKLLMWYDQALTRSGR